MSSNLHVLMKEARPQYAAGAPILLEACALYDDTTNGIRIAQLKWRNLESKNINAVSIQVNFWDSFDQHQGAVEHQYIGVNAAQGAIFGTQDAIILQNKMAVRMAVHVRAVSYTDGTVWSAPADTLFSVLPDAVSFQIAENLKAQHKRDLEKQGISNAAAQYLPQTYEDLWQCGCGRWQKTSWPVCEVCHATKEILLAVADESTISANLCAFEQETNQKAYDAAVAQMNNASNERAYLAVALKFEALGDFSDAQEMMQKCRTKADEIVKDSIYNEAMTYRQSELSYKQAKAAELFKKIPGWKDADALAEQCKEKKFKLIREEEQARQREKKLEKKKKNRRTFLSILIVLLIAATIFMWEVGIPLINYNKAEALMAEGKWAEASAAFTAAGTYSDASSRINEPYYKQGEALLAAQDEAGAIAAFKQAGTYSNAADRLKEIYYTQAEALMAEGKWAEASAAFTAAGTYSDASSRINEPYYKQGEALLAAQDEAGAIAAFKQAGTYSNAADRLKEIYYTQAEGLVSEGKYTEAYKTLISLDGYKDSTKKATVILNAHPDVQYKAASVGSYITFGSYEQNNNTYDGKEAIEWLVLAKENNRLLITSRYALDCQPYHTNYRRVTWETCTLRTWLNNSFLRAAFSAAEQAMIPTVTISTDYSNDTHDKVFLLSTNEAKQYFTLDSVTECKPTAYAVKQGASRYTVDGTTWWWLRSKGKGFYFDAAIVSPGGINEDGVYVDKDNIAVRPALWINLEP